MPKMNGTGPRGQGAGTGRGMGPCETNKKMGRGCFGRCGQGRGGAGLGRQRLMSSKSALENEKD